MLHAYFSLIFERISVKLGWYISSISSINPMNFQVRTPNVMVTVRQNNSSIHTSVQLDNKPRPVQSVSLDVRPRSRMMGHPRPQFRAKADLPVGFPYRFNSRFFILLHNFSFLIFSSIFHCRRFHFSGNLDN